jgi:L,D-transpeptidase ErfK/SrfK
MTIKNLAGALRCLAVLLAISSPLYAGTYAVPENGDTIIGEANYTTSGHGDTLSTIAHRYDLGVNAIQGANPDLPMNAYLPDGTRVAVPASHILPPMERTGIVINLPEMRMYFYPSFGVVKSYPIGIGRVGKTIPLARTKVIRKAEHPNWIPPDDIRAFNQKQGVTLPQVMPAGPDNPLGPYAIYLKIPTYLIHSTIYPDSIGTRASFGCIRMHESDIKDFFPLVNAGIPVTIIDMPNKVGWENNSLYFESHIPLEEHSKEYYVTLSGVVDTIAAATQTYPAFVDWQEVADINETHDGTPHEIGFKIGS